MALGGPVEGEGELTGAFCFPTLIPGVVALRGKFSGIGSKLKGNRQCGVALQQDQSLKGALVALGWPLV